MKSLKISRFCRYAEECRDFYLGYHACLNDGKGCREAEEREMEEKVSLTV